MSGVSPAVMPVMTAVTSAPTPQTTCQPTLSLTISGSTSLPANLGRGPSQTMCQAAVSQGARFK